MNAFFLVEQGFIISMCFKYYSQPHYHLLSNIGSDLKTLQTFLFQVPIQLYFHLLLETPKQNHIWFKSQFINILTRPSKSLDIGQGFEMENRERPPIWFYITVLVAILISILFRVYAIDRLPGINGDEAWYGVQSLHLFDDEPLSLRTPTKNLPSPIHISILALLHLFFRPSFILLRIPTVLASLSQILLTWFVIRKYFGKTIALYATILSAVLPVNIAYARFGWDASYTGLVSILTISLLLYNFTLASAVMFALAVTIHPTNIFLYPFLVLVYFFILYEKYPLKVVLQETCIYIGFLALGPCIFFVWTSVLPSGNLFFSEDILSVSRWWAFITGLASLVTGDTVFQFIVGEGLSPFGTPLNIAIILAFFLLSLLFFLSNRHNLKNMKTGVVLGFIVMALFFNVIAGPYAFIPHLERYGLVLILPLVLTTAVLCDDLKRFRFAPVVTPLLITIFAIGLLSLFLTYYLIPLENFGSTSHVTFISGPVEPKQKAFDLISKDTQGKPAEIICEDWWTYWAMSYLAYDSNIIVKQEGQVIPNYTYLVGYVNGNLSKWAKGKAELERRFVIYGASGREVIEVFYFPLVSKI